MRKAVVLRSFLEKKIYLKKNLKKCTSFEEQKRIKLIRSFKAY